MCFALSVCCRPGRGTRREGLCQVLGCTFSPLHAPCLNKGTVPSCTPAPSSQHCCTHRPILHLQAGLAGPPFLSFRQESPAWVPGNCRQTLASCSRGCFLPLSGPEPSASPGRAGNFPRRPHILRGLTCGSQGRSILSLWDGVRGCCFRATHGSRGHRALGSRAAPAHQPCGEQQPVSRASSAALASRGTVMLASPHCHISGERKWAAAVVIGRVAQSPPGPKWLQQLQESRPQSGHKEGERAAGRMSPEHLPRRVGTCP